MYLMKVAFPCSLTHRWATHYYQIMTRSPRMPVLIEERI